MNPTRCSLYGHQVGTVGQGWLTKENTAGHVTGDGVTISAEGWRK